MIFDVGVAGGPEHSDEDLGVTDLAGVATDDRHGRTAVVDEGLLAGPVLLAHAVLLFGLPLAVMVAVLAVAIGAVPMLGDVLVPPCA